MQLTQHDTYVYVQQALYNSIVPEKIDQVLNVWMSVKKLGKDRHFEKVKEVYHEKIASHKPCEECNRGMKINKMKTLT